MKLFNGIFTRTFLFCQEGCVISVQKRIGMAVARGTHVYSIIQPGFQILEKWNFIVGKKSIVLAILLVIAGHGAAAETKISLFLATGGTAGVYYPLGEGLAQILTLQVPGVDVTAKATDASIENVNLIAEHAVSLALVQNDISFQAVRGEKPFKEPIENLRMVARLYSEQVHCIATRSSGIKTLSDLNGKRVSVGASASGFLHVKALLSATGLKYSDVNADFLDFAHTAERLQNERLDAGFLIAGYPAAAVTALTALEDIDLVAFEEGLLNELAESYPFFVKDVIPAGAYPGVDHDTLTLAVSALLVCDAELPDDLVYGITKTLFENLDELKSAHEKAKSISLDKALEGAVIPLHPGAVKYYAETRLLAPAP